ncbi:unnamed protein product [Urochloa humidicola]
MAGACSSAGPRRNADDVAALPYGWRCPRWCSAFAAVVMPELDLDMQRENHLREPFLETKLSKDGFEVLSGLLSCNPNRRASRQSPRFSTGVLKRSTHWRCQRERRWHQHQPCGLAQETEDAFVRDMNLVLSLYARGKELSTHQSM